jgi:hypothetical protein
VARLTAEQLNASKDHEWDFDEEEVEIEELGGSILLREMDVHRQGRLLNGLTDKDGNVKDVEEMQVRLFGAACVDPPITTKEVRKFLGKWPASEAKKVMDAINKLGGPELDVEEEEDSAESEFPESD